MDCDIIGNVHGHGGALRALLAHLGYTEQGRRTPASGTQGDLSWEMSSTVA